MTEIHYYHHIFYFKISNLTRRESVSFLKMWEISPCLSILQMKKLLVVKLLQWSKTKLEICLNCIFFLKIS